MNPVARKLWITALRSGDYKQGQRFLCRVGPFGRLQYTAWGVLVEVAMPHLPSLQKYRFEKRFFYKNYACNEDVCLPHLVHAWAGIPYGSSFAITVTQMERRGATFAEIADYLAKDRAPKKRRVEETPAAV